MTTSQSEKHLIGPPRPTILVGTATTLTFLAFLFGALRISDRGGYWGFVGYMALLGSLGWLLLSGMTMRIVATPSELRLVNWFTTTAIPRSDVSAVEGKNGVVIYTRSGRRCVAAAYGSSQFQGIVASRRYARVAADIQEWASASAGSSSPPMSFSTSAARHRYLRAPRRPRQMLVIGLPLSLVGTQILGVILWSQSDILHNVIYR